MTYPKENNYNLYALIIYVMLGAERPPFGTTFLIWLTKITTDDRNLCHLKKHS